MAGKSDHKYCLCICCLICFFKDLWGRAGSFRALRALLHHADKSFLIKSFIIYHLCIPTCNVSGTIWNLGSFFSSSVRSRQLSPMIL